MKKLPKLKEMILEQIQLEIEDETRPPRIKRVFRASELGDCPRAIQYEFLGAKREPITPELAMLFHDGHLHHNDVRNQLRRIGRISNEETGFAKSYTIRDTPITLTVTSDGIWNGEYVIDIKSINFFSFKQLTYEYIEEKHSGYIDQIQAYLDVFEKEYGALIFKCKMTSQLKVFWYQRDPPSFYRALDRMVQVDKALDKEAMIKRPFKKSSRECKYCPMRKTCWSKK